MRQVTQIGTRPSIKCGFGIHNWMPWSRYWSWVEGETRLTSICRRCHRIENCKVRKILSEEYPK